jgi:hypothetical protein
MLTITSLQRYYRHVVLFTALGGSVGSAHAHPGHWSASSFHEVLHLLSEPVHWAGPLVILAALSLLYRASQRRHQRGVVQSSRTRHD